MVTGKFVRRNVVNLKMVALAISINPFNHYTYVYVDYIDNLFFDVSNLLNKCRYKCMLYSLKYSAQLRICLLYFYLILG